MVCHRALLGFRVMRSGLRVMGVHTDLFGFRVRLQGCHTENRLEKNQENDMEPTI